MKPPNDEEAFETWLKEVIEYGSGDTDDDEDLEPGPKSIRTFADAMLMTRNKGLILTFHNGASFQLTIVQAERGTAEVEDEKYPGEDDFDTGGICKECQLDRGLNGHGLCADCAG